MTDGRPATRLLYIDDDAGLRRPVERTLARRGDEGRAARPPDSGRTGGRGAVHGFGGDYGPRPGDGTPAADRAGAQREIVAAADAFLTELAG